LRLRWDGQQGVDLGRWRLSAEPLRVSIAQEPAGHVEGPVRLECAAGGWCNETGEIPGNVQ